MEEKKELPDQELVERIAEMIRQKGGCSNIELSASIELESDIEIPADAWYVPYTNSYLQ